MTTTPGSSLWLTETVDALSDITDIRRFFHRHRSGDPLPSGRKLKEVMELCRAVLFPGYFGQSDLDSRLAPYHIGVALERLHKLLTRQIEAGLLFLADDDSLAGLPINRTDAATVSQLFIKRLPMVRKLLASDVEAAYLGDPAAQTYSEVISCYPAIRALTNYRLAHELHRLNVPLIPRILTEMAHSETGIDIHPAAQIGPSFTIDHGTGVVIGATCIIGSHVKLYQGVTLGARSFPLDADGNPIKNIPRHPILEDRVVVYSNATVLGRIRIGHDAVIGGNLWVTSDVPPEARLVQSNRTSQ